MTGSELLEKILKRDIKSGTLIRIYADLTIKYIIDVWFMGNWFTLENPFEVSCPKKYNDIILYLCDKNAIFEIIEDKKLKKLKIENNHIIGKWKNGSDYCYTLSAPQTVLANKINEIIEAINEEKEIQDNKK